MELAEILKDYGYLISVVVVPIFLWLGSIWYQNRKIKRTAKQELFLRLMANRKKHPVSSEWTDALNQIDVVFQDNKSVRNAWREYFNSLNPKSQHFENQNSFLLDLLSEIANSLGYKNIKQTEIDRYYSPQFFQDQQTMQNLISNEFLRLLLHSESLNKTFSEEDYKKHTENLMEILDMASQNIIKRINEYN